MLMTVIITLVVIVGVGAFMAMPVMSMKMRKVWEVKNRESKRHCTPLSGAIENRESPGQKPGLLLRSRSNVFPLDGFSPQ